MRPCGFVLLSRRATLFGLLALPGLACTSEAPSGPKTVVITAVADPETLFPPTALNIQARQATELIYEYLADVGTDMNTIGDAGFVKQLASEWWWGPDSTSITFRINRGARWHDGVPVTSADVAYSYRVYSDSAVGTMLEETLADIDSVSTPDSARVVFWFARRSPRQFYAAAATMLILPSHVFGAVPSDSLRAAGARIRPVGSGQFAFSRWTHGSSLELTAVEDHHRGRAIPDRLVWSIVPEYRAALLRLLGGGADVFPNVRQETIPEIVRGGEFKLRSLPGMDYVFMQMNLRDPDTGAPHAIFGSRDLRRALTMALDRRSMVRNLFDTLAAVSIGPAVRASPTTDTSLAQIPYAPERASRILDSLGWRFPQAGSAVRSRNGKPLRFRLLVPVSSLSRVRLAVLMQAQLERIGVDVVIEQMDYSAFSARQSARSFDAALASWHLGSSPEAVKVTWTGGATERGGLNYGGYSNRAFDVLVDSALASWTITESREYFRRANQIIIDDAPAIWLYEPRTLIAIHSRISDSPMRPNAWWLGLAKWQVRAPEKRKAGPQ